MTSDEILAALADRKEYLDITYKELARKAGFAPTTVRDWLFGKYNPTFNYLVDLVEAMGLELVLREKKGERRSCG